MFEPAASEPATRQAVSVAGRADRVLLGICCAVAGLGALQVLFFAFGRDQSIYAQVGTVLLDGGMPYRDAWDFKPPGIFLIYAAAEAALGKSMMSIRIIEVAGLLGMLWAFLRFSQQFFGGRLPGVLGGAIAALVYAQLEFWHTGQPESFGGMLTAFALVITGQEPTTGAARLRQWTAMGVLFGLAFLLKPPLGGGAIVCGVYLARREFFRTGSPARAVSPIAVAAVASALPILLVAAWFFVRGAWTSLSWTLFEFTPGYTKLNWAQGTVIPRIYFALLQAVGTYSAYTLIGPVLAVALPVLSPREREGLHLLTGVVAIHLVGIVMQAKFFPYHYGATLPLLGLIAGLGFYKVWRRAVQAGPAGVAGFGLAVFGLGIARVAVADVPGTFWERSAQRLQLMSGLGSKTRVELDRELYRAADYNLDANREVALALRELTPEGARVFVWGFEPLIYWLSDRKLASPYIYNVAQRVEWEQGHARSELLADLTTPPTALVVQHHDVFPSVTGNTLDSAHALNSFPELETLLTQRYEKLRSVEDFDIYVLTDKRVAQSDALP